MNNDSKYIYKVFMKKFIQKTLILFLFFQFISFAQSITLNDAINMALEKNEKILEYKSKLKEKEYENIASWGNFLPSVNLQGSYLHMNKKLKLDLSPIRDAMIQLHAGSKTELLNIYNILGGNPPYNDLEKYQVFNQTVEALDNAIPSFVSTLKRQDYNTATFVGIQPLFLGGKLLAAKKYASAEEDAAKFELDQITNQVINNVAKSYLQNLLLKNVVKTRKAVLEGINNHKRNAQKLFEQGIIAKYHLLRAEVALADAEKNLINDKNNLELSKLSFCSLVDLPNSENIVFSDTLKYKEISDSLIVYLNKANSDQPIFKILDQKKIAAEQNYNVARSKFLPQVAAFGKYELYPEYLSALEPRWAVGVQAKLNIFNGFKDFLNLQSAQVMENEVDIVKRGIEKKINLWINKEYKDIENNSVQYKKLKASLILAKENLRQNSKRFDSGMGTSLEVIDALLALEKVELDMQIALFNYYSAISNLENAVGNSSNILKVWNK